MSELEVNNGQWLAETFAERQTLPLYFYPFLSTISNKATPETIGEFYATLDRQPVDAKDILLYIHIPYCKNICHFCGFYRDLAQEKSDVIADYLRQLIAEIRSYGNQPYIRASKIQAVYFGGGTPSLLTPEQIDLLFTELREVFQLPQGTEISFEGEVRSLKDPERLKVLREHECTRVSFGVQSFNPEVRKYAGLAATLRDVDECIDRIGQFGYQVNLDLMYGLPGQTMESWLADLGQAMEKGAVNVDIYDTVLYPQAKLFTRRNELKAITPDQDLRLKMIAAGIDLLLQSGYLHNTVEDFARPGHEYRMKRLVYGGGHGRSEIIALGAGAVGLINGCAYRNLPPDQYHQWTPQQSRVPIQLMYSMEAAEFDKRALVFFPKLLALNKQDVNSGWLESYRAIINNLIARGLIFETEHRLELTGLGKVWSDNIAFEFVTDLQEKQKIWKIGS